ncbi:TraV family lipoprotein [uncultured Photobacterium sp.]|uniref:TraV family lipoprotein n=1 Tax=uncultured Photobacterium sp. TaxID=173973 RepID=UPI002631212F|nr:TraV family lipoprotein [uncultured Photobacterium sp.]
MKGKTLLSLLAVSTMASLSGCATVVGEEQATCPGAQSGVICASSREVYELTNTYNNAEEYAAATGDGRVVTINNDGEQVSLASNNQGEPSAVSETGYQGEPVPQWTEESAYHQQLLPPPEPLAMRKPASIVRVLARPYATDADTLKVPGYAYIEAKSRTWVIDRNAHIDNAQFTSLKLRRESIQQDYNPDDSGEIGVNNRDGSAASPAPTNNQLQTQGRANAVELINQLNGSGKGGSPFYGK